MEKGKKGLSTIVTTLIIILLVIAAIGIVWGPIRSLLTNSTNSLDQTKCLSINLQATKVVNATGSPNNEDYLVTLSRTDSGSTVDKAGAQMVLYSSANNSAPLNTKDYGWGSNAQNGLFGSLVTATANVTNTGVINATKIEVTPYYVDSNGKEQICTGSTTSFSFSTA